MEYILSLCIIFIFFLVTLTVLYGLKNNESFTNFSTPNIDGDLYTKSKFYTYPLTKYEKINSLYTPIICRPPEKSGFTYSGNCTNTLYPKNKSPFGKGEMTTPCNPEIEAKYYAMRPLLQFHGYEAMLETIFKHIQEKIPKDVNESQLTHQNEFCNEKCYSGVMKFIMTRINQAKNNLQVFKDYAKNDTWGGEQFAFLNQKVFVFTKIDYNKLPQSEQAKIARYGNVKEPLKFIIAFTLYNTLRSTSTDVIATVFKNNNTYFLKKIDFATKKPTHQVTGVSISTKAGNSPGINLNNANLPPLQTQPNWIWGNNIENTTFNLKGFHDPDESNNILIPGGVPTEFKDILEKCDQGYLLDPAGTQGPRFKGGTSSNDANKTAPIFPMMPNKEMMRWEVNV